MNYKKGILSLVAIMALNNTVLADSGARYLPLTSATADSSWVLFGVNGFSDGTPSVAASASSFTAGFTELVDNIDAAGGTTGTAVDGLASWGLATGAAGTELVSLQGLGDDTSLTALSIGMDIAAYTYDATEPVRTIYVDVGNVGFPNMKFEYKASLEGGTIEIIRNGTSEYHLVLSEDYTWSNPATPTDGLTVATSNVTDMVAITEVLDYDFDNNPVSATDFNTTKHTDTVASTVGAAHFYHFNAINQQWEVWNKHAVAAANDFTDFTIGQAYWGRMDAIEVDGALTIDNATGPAGLILGNPSGAVSPSVYVDENNVSTLTSRWNMLAFDDTAPYIRHAATGLVISGLDAGGGDNLIITDSSGLYSVTTADLVTATIGSVGSIAINKQIESLKLRGLLPKSFNIKAFGTGTAGEIILISDKKFYVNTSLLNSVTIDVKTLAGANPYVNGVQTAVTNLLAAGASDTTVESVYGEYSMILELLTGAGTAAELDSESQIAGNAGGTLRSAKVIFGQAGTDNTALAIAGAANDAASTLATAITATDADKVFDGTNATGRVIAIDTTADDAADMAIAASNEAFYVKDATYTRVFKYDTAVSVAGTDSYVISNSTSFTVDPTVATAIANAALIQAQADDGDAGTGTYAAAVVNNIVIVTTENDTFDLKDADSASIDFLSAVSETDDVAKGAIKGIYSLDNLAAKALNQVTDSSTGLTTSSDTASVLLDTGDDWTITINGNALSRSGGLGVVAAPVDTYGEYKTTLDEMVTVANNIMTLNSIHGSASHDYEHAAGVTDATPLPAALSTALPGTITITGVDVATLVVTLVDNVAAASTLTTATTANAATGDNLVTLGSGDLTADATSNPTYTPNYAIYGPLYTMRDAGTGYDTRAVLKATTELDAANGVIAWDSIDITRNENEWFANNEFNEFMIDSNEGYWVYLEDKDANNIVINTPTLTASYAYYFERDAASLVTTNNINNGQLDVVVTGLGTSSAASVYATIGGEEIQMKAGTVANTYTADISKYSLSNFNETTAAIPVTIRAVDGKGKALKVTSILEFDYTKPTNVVEASTTATSVTFSADGNDTKNIYVFTDYIPESSTLAAATLSTSATNNAATFTPCAELAYGTTHSLLIVAADGELGSANVSNALSYNYAVTLRAAHVLTHTEGSGDALSEVVGTLYTDTCSIASPQPALATENNGVRLTTLATGMTTRMSFQPLDNTNFDQDLAWTSYYQVSGGTDVVQIQATSPYVGDTFYIEYNGSLYSSTFPTEANAGLSISGAPIVLTAVTAENSTLAAD